MLGGTIFNYWRWLPIGPGERPERTLSEAEKETPDYHLKCGRYYMGNHQGVYSDWFRMMAAINTGFANEQLWGMPEDKEMFLMDKGVSTTRRALRSPLIRPMVTRLVGQLSQVSIQSRTEAVTQRAKTRREDVMKQAVLFARAAQAGGPMKDAMASMGVSPDESEMEQMAGDPQTYQDMFVEATNTILTEISERNNLEAMRKSIGEQVAVAGMAAAHAYTKGNDLKWEFLSYDQVGWDTNATKPDFTDGEYCFVFKYIDVPTLCERFQPSAAKIKEIDSISCQQTNDYNRQWTSETGPRVATVYWHDQHYVTKGFIDGPNGPEMVDVDTIDPDTKKPYYTEKDLIDPPKNKYTIDWTGKTSRKCVGVIRFCTFIPSEFMPTGTSIPVDGSAIQNKQPDLVLDWGVYELQEVCSDDTSSVNFPIKFSSWSYLSGFVVAPISAAVSPQRVMNQVLSDVVWRMSKAKGGSRIIDYHALITPGQTVKQALFSLKEGDDVLAKSAPLGGVNQVVKETSGGYDKGLFEGLSIVESLQVLAERGVGIPREAMAASDKPNQLVGTKQLQLQQAEIMQQPFYDCVQHLYEQIHQFNAQAGRQWYIRHPWVLEDMVGTKNMDVLEVAGDLQYEQFRVSVKLALNSDQVKAGTDAMALEFFQRQLIDAATATAGLGEEYPDQFFNRVRRYTADAKAAAEEQAAMQQKQAEDALLDQQDMVLAQQESDTYNKMVDAGLQAEALNQKSNQPIAEAVAGHLAPQPDMAMA